MLHYGFVVHAVALSFGSIFLLPARFTEQKDLLNAITDVSKILGEKNNRVA